MFYNHRTITYKDWEEKYYAQTYEHGHECNYMCSNKRCLRTREFMKKIGIGPDCDAQWLGYFDTILFVYIDKVKKKHMQLYMIKIEPVNF